MDSPEIIIGLVGGVGTNLNVIADELEKNFIEASCQTQKIKITDHIKITQGGSYIDSCNNKISCIDRLRYQDLGVLASIVITEIFKDRLNRLESGGGDQKQIKVYIVNSLKHPQEYSVLRHVYRRNFIFLSVYCSKVKREENLKRLQRDSTHKKISQEDMDAINKLLESDKRDNEGTRLTTETYHKAHYFINYDSYEEDIKRFTRLLMNAPFETPSREEIGMAHAYVESLKTSDLSRQVGAAILNDDGNILSTGCNEVPKFLGGLHWHDTDPDLRDFKVQKDGISLSDQIKSKKQDEIASKLNTDTMDFLDDSLEFIRAVHAEEAAICDAAKRGISIQNATLYCTTYPCHLCTKHIIASGIKKVVYIEPYEKSLSEKLFKNLMKDKAEKCDQNLVKFISFRGVAPKRFRYIFRKNKANRKIGNQILEWALENSKPINLSHSTPLAYFWIEKLYINKIQEYTIDLSDDFNSALKILLDINFQEKFSELIDIFKDDETGIN